MVTIYAIFIGTFDKKYIGSTAGKLSKRLREHRCLLRLGKHSCKEMQTNYQSAPYPDNIGMQVVEVLNDGCTLDERRQAELKWMRVLADLGQLYNEHQISFQPPIGASAKAAATRVANGYRQSAESNEKRRLAQLGRPKGHGAKISVTKRAKAMR